MLIRALGLQLHLLNPLDKNPKEAKVANGSCILGFMLFTVKLQDWKTSQIVCVQINFLEKTPHTVTFPTLQESLSLFQNFSVTEQIARLLNKNYGLKVFLRILKSSCAECYANACSLES